MILWNLLKLEKYLFILKLLHKPIVDYNFMNVCSLTDPTRFEVCEFNKLLICEIHQSGLHMLTFVSKGF